MRGTMARPTIARENKSVLWNDSAPLVIKNAKTEHIQVDATEERAPMAYRRTADIP